MLGSDDASGLTVAVVLASANRPNELAEAISDVLGQTRPPDSFVISVPDAGSLPPGPLPALCQVVFRRGGLTAQRNAALLSLHECDVVFFFDDDAVIREDYIDQAVRIFAANPDVVGLTGRVLLDGAAGSGPEVPLEEAREALRRPWHPGEGLRSLRTLYGCNFAYRFSSVPHLRFDERLPLYSWLEDHDFARRLLPHGRIVGADHCVIVHRGVRSGGRAAHHRFGYSQVVNPLYLWKKGSFPLWLAAREIGRPLLKNVLYSCLGPQRSWRRERLCGNRRAFRDVLAGRLDPQRVLHVG